MTLDEKSRPDTLFITFLLTNTSPVAGDEVPQLYIHGWYASVAQPLQKFSDFERISLATGASQTVAFALPPEKLKIWDKDIYHVMEPLVSLNPRDFKSSCYATGKKITLKCGPENRSSLLHQSAQPSKPLEEHIGTFQKARSMLLRISCVT